jgi:hypothetical protein
MSGAGGMGPVGADIFAKKRDTELLQAQDACRQWSQSKKQVFYFLSSNPNREGDYKVFLFEGLNTLACRYRSFVNTCS